MNLLVSTTQVCHPGDERHLLQGTGISAGGLWGPVWMTEACVWDVRQPGRDKGEASKRAFRTKSSIKGDPGLEKARGQPKPRSTLSETGLGEGTAGWE